MADPRKDKEMQIPRVQRWFSNMLCEVNKMLTAIAGAVTFALVFVSLKRLDAAGDDRI